MTAVAVLPDGRVVTGGRRRAGAGVGPGRRQAPARSSWAATTARCAAVAVLPDGRVVTGGRRRAGAGVGPGRPGAGPVELGRHDDSAVPAVAVLPDGRVVTGGDRRAGAGVGPGPARRRPGRARPPPRRGNCGGGAAGRAGGHRRERRAGAGVGPGPPGAGPVELGWHHGAVFAVAVLPDGQVVTPASAAGCGCGIRPARTGDPSQPPARSNLAVPQRLGGDRGGGAAGRPGSQRRERRTGACVGPGPARSLAGRARPPRRRLGDRGGCAAGRPGGQRRVGPSGPTVGRAKQLDRQSSRMFRVRARYLALPIRGLPLHRSRRGRNFTRGGARSDTEHA